MGFLHLCKQKNSVSKSPETCLGNIKRKIAERTGITKFIDLDDVRAAFSGTADHYDLYVSLDTVKRRGKQYLHAYMEDHLEWNEWEYTSQDAFEDSIVSYICEKINRTIKTVTETKKHKYIRVTEYYLDPETNEWILMSDDKISWRIMRPFMVSDSVTEEIKEYHL